MQDLAGNHDEFVSILRENIVAELDDQRLDEIEELESKILAVQESVMQLHKDSRAGLVSHPDYEKRITQAEQDIKALRQSKTALEVRNEQVKLTEFRLDSIEEMLGGGLFLEGFNEQLFNDLIDTVIIHADRYEFIFKCGLTMQYQTN